MFLTYIKDLHSNVFGQTPIIFLDSHPEEQDSYVGSYLTSLKSTLSTAWTGIVPPFLEPGELRVIWWTQEGTEGSRDYPLRKHAAVRDYFDELVKLEEVRRVAIMGYAGQNPYAMTEASRLLVRMLDENEVEVGRTKRVAREREGERMGEGKVLVDVDSMVEETRWEDEKAKLKAAEERDKVDV